MNTRAAVLPVMCALLMLTACAKAPTEQIAAAEKAVTEAQQSGAATYVADEYAKIEGTMAALKKEVSEQDGKFALLRDYGKVEQLAAAAKSDAERVKVEAATKKEEAKAAALQAQQVAQEAVASTLALVAKAPTGKDRAALESIKADAKALKESLNQVQAVASMPQITRPRKPRRRPFTRRARLCPRKSRQRLPRSERKNLLQQRISKID